MPISFHDLSVKLLRQWSIPWTPLKIPDFFTMRSIFTKTKSEHKKTITAASRRQLYKQLYTKLKKSFICFVGDELFC